MTALQIKVSARCQNILSPVENWNTLTMHMRDMLVTRGSRVDQGEMEMQGAKPSGKSIILLMLAEDKLSVKTLRTLTAGDRKTSLILVTLLGPTAFTRREIQDNNPNVELFLYSDFQINPTAHVLVPQHEILSAEEVRALVKRYGSVTNFPKLPPTDVIARYYGLKSGEVVRIMRRCGFQESTPYYRVVGC